MKRNAFYLLLIIVPSILVSCGNNKPAARIEKTEKTSKLDTSLVRQLAVIYEADQLKRREVEGTLVKYGISSKQMDSLMRTIAQRDSVNVISVKAILDHYGWPGPDVIGETGSAALFLVIQHADTKSQIHYLPLMRTAVKEQKAAPSDLALLEDRVALAKGKKQIYGSQFGWNAKTKKYYLFPLEDPDHVNERRAKMGLGTIEDAFLRWRLKWNSKDYK